MPKLQALTSHSTRVAWLRSVLAAIFLLSIALAIAAPFRLWERRLEFGSDASFPNAFSVLLWLLATALAVILAKRSRARLGWLSICVLALAIAIGEAGDIKDAISRLLFSTSQPYIWMLVVAPIALPFVVLATRTLWLAARSLTQRLLLIAAAIFAIVPLVLDSLPMPIGLAEEGSEQMAAAVLIAVLLSVLGWMPLSPTLITWRFVAIVAVFTALVAGILDAREYEIRVAGATRDRPEIHHGPFTAVSQILQVDRANLSRIDVFAETEGGSADLFLRLTPPGRSPVRESSTTTSHPRWSNRTVTFDFPPITDSAGQTYEITVGVLQSEPGVFIGLSNDNPIPESNVFLHGNADVWSNDLALRAYTPGRGLVWLVSMIQDRDFVDVLMGLEVLIAWLWGVVVIMWWTMSGLHKNKALEQ